MNKHIVKPMQRGQVTIPQEIRQKLGITTDTYLWVSLTDTNKIVIQPVPQPSLTVNTMPKGTWMSSLQNNPTFDFLADEPDIYTPQDGHEYDQSS